MLTDRHRRIATGEMLAGGLGTTTAPIGDRLRRLRRFLVCDAMQIALNVMQGTCASPAPADAHM